MNALPRAISVIQITMNIKRYETGAVLASSWFIYLMQQAVNLFTHSSVAPIVLVLKPMPHVSVNLSV